MNTTDIITRLVDQLDEEITAGYEAVGLLERARAQLLEFTDLPGRMVDTLAVDIGLQPATSDFVATNEGKNLAPSGPPTADIRDVPLADRYQFAEDRLADRNRYKTHNPQRKYTLHQVAEIWHLHSQDKAGARNQAIADQLGISIKGAEQAVIRARKKGMIPATGSSPATAAVIPPAPAADSPADPTPDNYDPDAVDWEAVAACYKLAVIEGRRPIAAIANQFDVPRHVAQDWPKVCRRLGLLPPADQPQVETDPAPQQLIRHTPGRPVAL